MNNLHLEKKGLRGLAIAESFKQGDKESRLAGVVIRRDFIIDGFILGQCTIGGDDSSDAIIQMYSRLDRDDISFVMISGLIISMYNMVNIKMIHEVTKLPVIGVTYADSEGIEDAIKRHFPNASQSKIEQYLKIGNRTQVTLHTGHELYIRTEGCSLLEAKKLLDMFTIQGSIPEPIRIAQLLARTPVS